MIVHSSALIAILNGEPDLAEFTRCVERTGDVRVSAGTILETWIVAGPTRHKDVDDLLSSGDIAVIAFDEEQARVARRAYVEYGKGSGSPARLNFGDCFAYALAKTTGQPLLFKGDDFTHTDVTPAI